MKKWLLEAKMKWNELRQKVKKMTPKWFKAAWVLLATAMLCAIIVEGASAALPSLESHKLILGILSGRWVWPQVEKLLNKVLRRK